jgi:hypothetical protein
MRAANLYIVRPQEGCQAPQMPVNWKRGLPMAGTVMWWGLWVLWQVTKLIGVVAVLTASVALIMIGVLAHFVQGPLQR